MSLASGAKPVVARRGDDEARAGGKDKVNEALRPKDHSKAVCEEAIAKVQEAAVETFDAKVRDWLLGGGGNGSGPGDTLPRVPLKVHEVQLQQIEKAVGLPLGEVKKDAPLYSDEASDEGALRFDERVEGTPGPNLPDLRGQPYLKLPRDNAPGVIALHVQRPCLIYVLLDPELQPEPSWLSASRLFRKLESTVSAVRGTGEQQQELKLVVYESQKKLASTSSSHKNAGECVIIGNHANQAPASPDDSLSHAAGQQKTKPCEGGGLRGCVVVVAYQPRLSGGELDKPRSDAQMLMEHWFQGGPENEGRSAVSNPYGHFRCRSSGLTLDNLPLLDYFLERSVSTKKTANIGANAGGGGNVRDMNTGGGCEGTPWREDWELRVSAIVRRWVASLCVCV